MTSLYNINCQKVLYLQVWIQYDLYWPKLAFGLPIQFTVIEFLYAECYHNNGYDGDPYQPVVCETIVLENSDKALKVWVLVNLRTG